MKAVEQAILYACQKQITPYSSFWGLGLTEIMGETGLLLVNALDDFTPTAEQRDELVKVISEYLDKICPDDFCETCDGSGRFVSRRWAGSQDWEITGSYHCDNCDGTGISDLVHAFSNGESYICWRMSNCRNCSKHNPFDSSSCDIDNAITEAYYTDGMVTKAISKRMSDEQGKCTEFVPRGTEMATVETATPADVNNLASPDLATVKPEAKTENFGFSEEAS